MSPDRDKAAVFDALHIPPSALEAGGVEVLRCAIVDGALHVSLRRAFDDPEAWGMLIADITRHVARVYATEDKFREEETIARIRWHHSAIAFFRSPARHATSARIAFGSERSRSGTPAAGW
jgi:hypothetical protein